MLYKTHWNEYCDHHVNARVTHRFPSGSTRPADATSRTSTRLCSGTSADRRGITRHKTSSWKCDAISQAPAIRSFLSACTLLSARDWRQIHIVCPWWRHAFGVQSQSSALSITDAWRDWSEFTVFSLSHSVEVLRYRRSFPAWGCRLSWKTAAVMETHTYISEMLLLWAGVDRFISKNAGHELISHVWSRHFWTHSHYSVIIKSLTQMLMSWIENICVSLM